MQLLIFKYEEGNRFNDLTTVEINGQIWFVASDVCSLLEITNVTQALASLEDDEKLPYVLHRAGQKRSVNLISESGLYALVFKSRKDTARRFRKWVTKEVIPAIRITGSYGINRQETPNFVIRFNENWHRVDRGMFSVISELFVRLYGRFEQLGYQIPNKAFDGKEIRPDVSVGRGFAQYLRDYHPDVCDEYTTYRHRFPNGLEVDARQYGNKLLHLFLDYVDNHWIPNCAERYFNDRDKKALDYLPKLLPPARKAS